MSVTHPPQFSGTAKDVVLECDHVTTIVDMSYL